MLKRSVGVLFLALLLAAGRAAALETTQVLVLPFTIHADQDLAYLQEEIPNVLREHLESEGAVFVPLAVETAGADAILADDVARLRQLGLEAGADQVVWGSLTRIGDSLSLDVNLLETLGDQPAVAIFEAGTGMENLRAIAKRAAEKLALRMFRQETIVAIRIEGNKRIEADAIERVIRAKAGDPLRTGELSKDVKNIYKMGYFDDIRVAAETVEGGRSVVFQVKEKPTIRNITFKGNEVFKDEKLKENLSISTGSILNIFTVKANIDQLQALYKEKNYHNIKIVHTVRELDNNQADLEFVIEEGEKIRIQEITFEGNKTFTEKQLKKLIKTSEKGFFSWITSSGEYNREDLSQDGARIMAHYHSNGFIRARVAEPEVAFKEQWIHIAFKIDEGERFKVGSVDLEGDLIIPRESLMPRLQILKEPYFNREIVRADIIMLTDLYADSGFAYADITPVTREDDADRLVHITYTADKKERVYFENIVISGNTRTRDKVIRRELRIHERELYNGSHLKRSIRNLNRLDYFEDVKVNTPRGSTDNQMNVNVEVVEKPTGQFTFGAGYSTADDFFITGSVAQRNLFGRGQILKLAGQIGGASDLYNVSFTEPWMFDIPLSGTATLFRLQRDYDTYERTSTGGSLGFSYPVYDFTRLGLTYRYDLTDLSEVTVDASDNIKELVGENATSSITTALRYDSRDRVFNTTEGQDHSITYTYAGMGGDVGFHKVVGRLGWYRPVWKELVSFIHGEAGYVRQISGYILPDYEKFYLGGMNSVRGFDYREINIKTINSAGIESEEGGESYAQFNFELTYPLVKDLGIVGVVFYDTGNVYARDESIDLGNLRHAAGYGIRWYSPVGPIRIEGGHILDPEEGEDSGVNWEFSMGSAF